MKLSKQHRFVKLDAARTVAESRTVDLTWSSEEPYDRWWGTEILVHDKDSVMLGRLNNGAPLLFNHRMDDVIGVVESATIDDDRRGHATVRFAKSARGEEIFAMVQDGILSNVSVAYRVLTVEEQVKEEIFRVTEWEPLEISIVTIPADPTVGVGRTDEEQYEVRMVRAEALPANPAAQPKGQTMKVENAAAGAGAENSVSAVDAEKERRQAIINLCKSNKIDARVETRWIEEGTPLTLVASEILNVMEERGKARPAIAAEIGLSRSDAQKYSLFRVIRHLKQPANPKYRQEAAFEVECSEAVGKRLNRGGEPSIFIPAEVLTRPLSQEAMQRAMATTPGGKGGYMVNVQNMGFIEILRARSVVMAMGARQLSGLEGNVMFPRQTGKSTVTWQGGEGTNVTATDQALGQLSMTPKTAIIVTDVSEQLLRQSSPSAEQFVMADLAATIAIDGVDNAALNGTGGAQPIGIRNTLGITSGQDAATFSYAKALAFPVAAGSVNAIRGNPGWVTNIAGAAIAMQRQRFTSTDSPLWQGNLLDGQLIGFNAMSSEQLSAGQLIFGSWDELVIGEWGVLELATDNGGTRFNQAQVGIRAMWMVDVMLRYPQSFVVSTNLS
jgi:HK97 family phage major capsid protein/HK97 family phage prohead protease